MYRYSRFQKILCIVVLFCLALPPASFAAIAETAGVSNLIGDIGSIAKGIGRHDRPSADVSKIAAELLIHSDQLICDSWVISASVALRNLIIADAGAPSVQRQQLIRKMTELRDKIVFACQQYVYNEHLGIKDQGAGAVASGQSGSGEPSAEAAEPVAPAGAQRDPRYTVEEQICMERCGDLYWAYDRARREAIQAQEDAERSSRELADASRRAAHAHEEAEQMRGPRDQAKAAYDQAFAQWARTGGSRADVNIAMDRYDRAATQYRRAELAAQKADADVAAKTASVRTNERYAAMRLRELETARDAYLDCARKCVSEAAQGGVTVDPGRLFRHSGGSPAPTPRPAEDTRPRSVSTAPVAPPAGSVLHSPGYAFPGGTISGQVMGPDNQPVANAPVQLTTITGLVIATQTDDQGRWESKVPAGANGKLTATLVGLAGGVGTAAVMKVVNQTPHGIPAQPASYLQPGQVVDVAGNYPEVVLEDPSVIPSTEMTTSAGQPVMHAGGTGVIPSQPAEVPNETGAVASNQPAAVPNETGMVNSGQTRIDGGADPVETLNQTGSVALPTVRSVSADGSTAITRYTIPNSLPSRQLLTVMTNDQGQTKTIDTTTFTAAGRIDNNQLRSGQGAEFVYDFQFPAGEPRKVYVRVDATGAINYKDAGKVQTLKVNSDGTAQLKGRVRATTGTPAGAAFAIMPTVLQ